MKILALHNIESPLPAVDAIPDSAILRDGKPFFIPAWSDKWIYTPMIAFKVGRLGKNIAKKFALRYVDAVTIALRVIPKDAAESLNGIDVPKGILTAFDSSVILGEWTSLPEGFNAPIAIKVNDYTASSTDIFDCLSASIETLSKYFTLKMGDIILPIQSSSPEIPMIIDTSVIGSINQSEILKFNIK